MKPAPRKWNNSAFAHQSKFEVSEEAAAAINNDQVKETSDKKTLGKEEIKRARKRKAVLSKEISAQTLGINNSSNWIERFEPTKTEDVAVHPKKLAELQDWFLHCEAVRKQHPAQLCLITGPSGSGKTAAVRAIAGSLKYELNEWINPVDRETINTLGDQQINYSGSQLELFKSFLFRSSRYKSLMGSHKRLVLVEDFPNMLLSNIQAFENILEDYTKYAKSPLIFIVTDTKSRSLNISYNLFTDQIKTRFHINHISFNSIATTLLQKALKRCCNVMKEPQIADNYSAPSQAIIDSIVYAAQGDIRNAIINLHFASLRGTNALPLERVESGESKNKSKKHLSTLKTIRRDESVTMMHALGRVFNPKRLPNNHFTHTPEDISESFDTEPKRFIDLLHANYLPHFSEIEHIIEAINSLSITDNIINEYREEALAPMALNIAIRSIMVANEKPVSAWMPIRAPKRCQMDINDVQHLLPGISMNLYATDYASYVKIIRGSKILKHQ
ncbi:cell cycle checkpoint protein RAD17 [Eurosta solidaginis]|uniref:cell cycle checkpoint protein RAD17 n=1 Tax=Eurosta solidaginis TaxID=178769 RepID=UPI0035316710